MWTKTCYTTRNFPSAVALSINKLYFSVPRQNIHRSSENIPHSPWPCRRHGDNNSILLWFFCVFHNMMIFWCLNKCYYTVNWFDWVILYAYCITSSELKQRSFNGYEHQITVIKKMIQRKDDSTVHLVRLHDFSRNISCFSWNLSHLSDNIFYDIFVTSSFWDES